MHLMPDLTVYDIMDILHWVLLHHGTGVVEISEEDLRDTKATRLVVGRKDGELIARIEEP